MKAVLIAAPSSGSGKTTVTMGIIRALKNKGCKVSCFKTGPDYIDTAFLQASCGSRAGNLDMHLQGEEGMKKALSLDTGDICIIEGAMGYFDGIYNTFENSSYDISRSLGINSILIYTPKGEMFTAVPKIKGMAEFQDSNIKGVIFNRVTKHYYQLLKEAVEKYTDLKVLGFIPAMEDVELKSRHLGLVQSVEVEDIESRIEKVAKAVAEYVDMEALKALTIEIEPVPFEEPKKRKIKAAVAMDKAFSFYYRENLYMLEKSCDVVYFSPLNDKVLPDCDFLYLGGGYPEVFNHELSKNTSMTASIKSFAEAGGCIYAECGGFMYLLDTIEDARMAGVLKGSSCLTKSLQRFGYIDIELKEDCMLGAAGDKLTAHEFHKSTSIVDAQPVYKIKKTMGNNTWECGYRYKNVFAAYPHISFLGNMKAFESLLDYTEKHS